MNRPYHLLPFLLKLANGFFQALVELGKFRAALAGCDFLETGALFGKRLTIAPHLDKLLFKL